MAILMCCWRRAVAMLFFPREPQTLPPISANLDSHPTLREFAPQDTYLLLQPRDMGPFFSGKLEEACTILGVVHPLGVVV